MNPDLNAIARALDRLITAQQKGAWDYIGTIAVVLTLVVLIWYTVETYRLRKAAQSQTEEAGKLLTEAQRQNDTSLRLVEQAQRQNEVTADLVKEAQRQNEVALMPLLAVLVISPERLSSSEVVYGHTKTNLVVRNVGTGPAFNVTIDKWLEGDSELKFLHGSQMLSPGEEHTLSVHLYKPDSGISGNVNTLYEWINNGSLPDPVNIKVRCRSAIPKEYVFTFSFTPSEGRLKVSFEGLESVSAA